MAASAAEDQPEATGASVEVQVSRDTLTYGDYEYELFYSIQDAITITKYTGNATDVTIPSNIQGYTVTFIGDSAFSNCNTIKSVSIPDSVISLSASAFKNCSSLTNVDIGTNVIDIGYFAFENCTALTKVNIWGNPGPGKLGDDIFKNCNNLTIYGYNDAYMHEYADNNNIQYVVLSDDKNGDTDNVKFGDIDGDDKISAKDSLNIQRYVINLKKLDEDQLKAADVNGDGKVTAKDALEILRYTIHMSKNDKIGAIIA